MQAPDWPSFLYQPDGYWAGQWGLPWVLPFLQPFSSKNYSLHHCPQAHKLYTHYIQQCQVLTINDPPSLLHLQWSYLLGGLSTIDLGRSTPQLSLPDLVYLGWRWAVVCFHGQLTIGVGLAMPSPKTPSSSRKPSMTLTGLHVGFKLPETQYQMALLLIVVAGSSFSPATTIALTPGFFAPPLSSPKIHGYRPTFVGCARPTAPWNFAMGTSYSLNE